MWLLNDPFRQLCVFAQGGDMEGWADLLIFLVVAVFWVLGALVKAIKRKPHEAPAKAQGPPRESWQQRLARRAEELQRAAEMRQPRPAGQRTAPDRPTPQGGEVKVRPGRAGESVLVYERDQSQTAAGKAKQEARQRQAREAVAAAQYAAAKEPTPELKVEVRGLSAGPATEGMAGVTLPAPAASIESGIEGPLASRESTGYGPGWVIDYDDPDALRKAVLHYEILGRPLGLRDPAEQSHIY